MKILQVAELLDPKHGGIAEGVFQQGLEFHKLGHQMECASADAEPVARFEEARAVHHNFPPAIRKWLWSPDLRPWFRENISRFDIVVLNGLWMGPMHEAARAAQKQGIPYVVMPHGMMDPYFRQGKKQFIKDLYWKLSEAKTFRHARAVFFTAEDEEKKARASYPLDGLPGKQVGYGIRDPERAINPRPETAEVRLCFMSRIHPKKGLDLVIEALKSLPDSVSLDVWGTGEPAYQQELKTLAQPLGDRVRWRGFASGEGKWAALEECDAMILSSYQENFGVVVAEAMSIGRPVLISKEVNIWREVEGDGAGTAEDATVEGALRMIQRFASLSADQRRQMGEKGIVSFRNRFTIERAASQFLKALAEAAGK